MAHLAETAPALARAVSAACPSALRARGKALAEEGRARWCRRDEDAFEYRVADGTGRIFDVVLFPEDAEWSCDCDGRFEACEHVVAALWTPVGEPAATAADDPERPVEIRYELHRHQGGLALRRTVRLSGGGSRPLARPDLARLPGLRPVDRAVEEALARAGPGRLDARTLAAVLEALRGEEGVTLDNEPVRVEGPTKGVRVVVRDSGSGVEVRLVREPGIEETFQGGAVLQRGAVRPLVPTGLARGLAAKLRDGIFVPPADLGRLASELLPELRRTLPVRIATDRLPGTKTARPRLDLVVRDEGGGFSAAFRVVYGNPPVAAVEDGRFRVLRTDGPVPIRRPEEERALLARAEAAVGLPPSGRIAVGIDEAPERAEDLVERLAGIGVDVSAALAPYASAGELEPIWDERTGLAFETGGRRADPAAVLRAFESGGRFVRLDGGGLARVPRGFLESHADWVAAYLSARGEGTSLRGRIARARVQMAVCGGLPRKEALLAAVLGGRSEADVPEPPGVRAALRPYQVEGVRFLAARKALGLGALLADDMGLGKTVQTLAVVDGRALVVAPTSVLGSWETQARRFRPDLRVARYHGPGRRLDPDADLTVTTWGVLRQDADVLAAERWKMVVLDESHTIKNPESAVAGAAMRLTAEFRLALTGTPVENRAEDLWPQLTFLLPGLFGDLDTFRARYVRGGESARRRLERDLGPFVLRRRKETVARDLPPRTEIEHRVELSEPERAFYGAVAAAARQKAASGREGAVELLEHLLRIRQAACDGGLVPGAPETIRNRRSAKLERLGQLLEELVAEGHKVLVFSQWTSLLDRVEPVATGAGARFVRLDGSTRDREGVVQAFSDPHGPEVMLVSLKAGGVGLTLTAADHVVLLDPWWNPAVEDQAAGRAHRIGQTRPVFVHRIVAGGTVEDAILALQAEKRRLAADLVGEGGGRLDRRTVEDLLRRA